MYKYLFIAFVSMMLNSCVSIYCPPATLPTLFTKRNDLLIGGSYSALFNANIAYSPIKYVFLHGEVASQPKQDNGHFHKSFSGGIGFYRSFNNTYHLETQFAYGQGEFHYGNPIDGSDARLTLASGDYSFYNSSIAFSIIKQEKFKYGLMFKFGNVNVNYDFSNINRLENKSFDSANFAFGYFMKPRICEKLNATFYTGYNHVDGNSHYIRSNRINFRIGLELKIF